MPNPIAEPPSAPASVRTRKRRCFPSPDSAKLAERAGRREEGHVRVAEAEGGESSELLAELERERNATRHDRVDAGHAPQVVLGQHRRGMLRKGRGELLDALGSDREARRSAVAAEALEEARARA